MKQYKYTRCIVTSLDAFDEALKSVNPDYSVWYDLDGLTIRGMECSSDKEWEEKYNALLEGLATYYGVGTVLGFHADDGEEVDGVVTGFLNDTHVWIEV